MHQSPGPNAPVCAHQPTRPAHCRYQPIRRGLETRLPDSAIPHAWPSTARAESACLDVKGLVNTRCYSLNERFRTNLGHPSIRRGVGTSPLAASGRGAVRARSSGETRDRTPRRRHRDGVFPGRQPADERGLETSPQRARDSVPRQGDALGFRRASDRLCLTREDRPCRAFHHTPSLPEATRPPSRKPRASSRASRHLPCAASCNSSRSTERTRPQLSGCVPV